MRFKYWTYLFLIAFAFQACSDDDGDNTEPVFLGYQYAPLVLGSFVEYEVDSITYDDFTTPVRVDTFRYQIREEIDSVFFDLAGRVAYRLNRYYRASASANYHLLDIWSVTRTTQRLERQEENVRFMRLVFPIQLGTEWNGNALNTLDEQEYQCVRINQSEEINGIFLDSVLAVIQIDEENLIERMFAEERYAAGIGLVYKKEEILDLNFDTGAPENGYILTYQMINWGRE